MNLITKLYYTLTAYIPRKLPQTPEDYEHFKLVLVNYFDVPDQPQIWIVVAGQITSTPGHKLRKPWGEIANYANRMRINNLAQGHSHVAKQELNSLLEQAINKEIERTKAEESNVQEASKVQPTPNVSAPGEA